MPPRCCSRLQRCGPTGPGGRSVARRPGLHGQPVLVQSKLGRWEEAVGQYQAGLGLAPGRVPTEIIQEYYVALAQYLLTAERVLPAQQLAAAKYLALAGRNAEAMSTLQAINDNPDLNTRQRCQVLMAWSGSKLVGMVWPGRLHGR